jgi:hypothetical protein
MVGAYQMYNFRMIGIFLKMSNKRIVYSKWMVSSVLLYALVEPFPSLGGITMLIIGDTAQTYE